MSPVTIRRLAILIVSGLLFTTAFPPLGAVYITPVFGIQLLSFLLYGVAATGGLVSLSRSRKSFVELIIGLYILTLLVVFFGGVFKLFVVLSWPTLFWVNLVAVVVAVVILMII